MRARTLAAALVAVSLAANCTSSEPDRDLPDVDVDVEAGSETPAPTTTPAVAPEDVPTDAGRIVVLDEAGTLSVVAPDGSDAIVLDEATAGSTFAAQPTWSPDGRRVAWVHVESGVATVVTTTRDGEEQTEAETNAPAFYLSWDPTSSRIAYLGAAAETGIEMGIVDVAGGGARAQALDEGNPFFLSWDPSGERMIVHVGTDRLERLELDGSLTTIDAHPGAFSAPAWTSDGERYVYATETGGRQRLVAHDVAEPRGRTMLPFDGAITFVVSPDGERVAYQVVESQEVVHPLSVVDASTGRVEDVAEGFVPSFFWSPDGDRLLFLVPEPDADRVWFRWNLWDGDSTVTSPTRFFPTLVFGRDYLQFFEQYAQSMTLWSPDGSAFVYAGTDETGTEGVWVQAAEDDAAPILVADGVYAAWSPR